MEVRLLEKTELWISPVELIEVDLNTCAQSAAKVLGLKAEEIMVTDVLEDRLTLDILVPTIQAEQILAREKALLQALAKIPGVHLKEDTRVHSNGILGLISLDETIGKKILKRSEDLGDQIRERIRRRSLIFPTGQEVLKGQIRDTNTPFLLKALRKEGYFAAQGPILEDRAASIARAFRAAMEAGYGLILTTGGIGAEDKDQTLEALIHVDPQATLPYILKFEPGQGRHTKDGVRLGVGQLGATLIICLPGPHDEVQLSWPVLIQSLKSNLNKEGLGLALAKALRKKFLDRSKNPFHPTSHLEEVNHGPE